ncbi:MAG: winged helix-turn-helix domain-containing protein [Chloroflexi bacterium CFX4]|nr:winged helix-turn-helix domain-containing protein [Chloroflexi bacterium CFX4]MDL1922908.1 winged helix-turn-helix domain-containing protein [Chloroflexi bacterium CFX3]
MPKRSQPTLYPTAAAQRVALHAQGLSAPFSGIPDAESLYAMIERIGCLQIDTLQLVRRSQYLTLWSRLGNYTAELLDQVAYGDPSAPPEARNRRLFEYWLKAACFIPLSEYRYRLARMQTYREGNNRWFKEWVSKPEHKAALDHVLERIRREGALRSADFEYKGEKRSGWFDWKPTKHALEHLYNAGVLMIDRRQNFQRVYDLTERVLPDWVDRSLPSPEEHYRHLLVRAVRALGICKPEQMGFYFYMTHTNCKPFIKALIAEGVLESVQIVEQDGTQATYLMHREDRHLIDQAAEGALTATHTTFLSPFDNLFWAGKRTLALWNFEPRIEMYKPEPQRRWGYFSLPILHGERLIGRFDPKLDRKSGVLHLKALHLEEGVQPDEALITAVADALRQFMAWHAATDLQIARSAPAAFGEALLRAM